MSQQLPGRVLNCLVFGVMPIGMAQSVWMDGAACN